MSKINLAVVFGSAGSEHDVSLMSVTSLLNNIDREKYDITTLAISKEGEWFLYEGPTEKIIGGAWQSPEYITPAIISPDMKTGGILVLDPGKPRTIRPDVVFPAMHGEYAEDGAFGGLLRLAGIPSVGADILANALCLDKDFTHKILSLSGIDCARYFVLLRHDRPASTQVDREIIEKIGGYPVFVKPASNGSSVGVTKVKSAEEIDAALDAAFACDRKILVQERLSGAEVECAVMGNDTPIASDVIGEVAPTTEFYDYNSKYYDNSTGLHIPARISPAAAEKIRQTAISAYKATGCRGLARIDFFADGEKIYLNEINTLPGFTHISMFPKLFEASGVSYPDLIDRLINYALEK